MDEFQIQTVTVLDKGFVRLIDAMGNDTSIVRAARVSYDKANIAGEDKGSDKRLIRYLLNNNHTSPFEQVTFTFHVKLPIFIARQWMRHRTWSFNEISGRYTELPDDFYIPSVSSIGVQSTDNKQMRLEFSENVNAEDIVKSITFNSMACYNEYTSLLELGCPRELARSVLPLNIYTEFYATVDLHNLMHFLRLRTHSHSQYEIREYAKALLKLIEPIVPFTTTLLKEELDVQNG